MKAGAGASDALAAMAIVIAIGAAMGAVPAHAAEPPCADPKSHQFDFWIGEWEVSDRDGGQIVGRNRIRPILDGCVLQETWTGVSGSAGSSLNFYDPSRRQWRQFWVWREGTTLELEGSFADGSMTMTGDSTEPDGSVVRNRITWFDQSGKTVRQLWEKSKDGGKIWQTEFDGIYRRSEF